MNTRPESVDVVGVSFHALRFHEVVNSIKVAITENSRLQVVPGSIDTVVKAHRDPSFAVDLAGADLVVPDGVPIVWAAKILGSPLSGRVSGTDLVTECAAISADMGVNVAFLGATFDVASEAAGKLEFAHPRARIYPVETPYPLTDESSAELAATIKGLDARIICVALGAPRQEHWIATYLEASGANVGIGCGSAFEIISGRRPRAPAWMRDNGLEWLYRMSLEPRRLGRRYLVEDSVFFWYLIKGVTQRRFRAGKAK